MTPLVHITARLSGLTLACLGLACACLGLLVLSGLDWSEANDLGAIGIVAILAPIGGTILSGLAAACVGAVAYLVSVGVEARLDRKAGKR